MGVLLLCVITPLSQFLTIQTTNVGIETDTPVGWAVGLLVSIVLSLLVIRLMARREVMCRANLALLYGMLALAVPLMNIGLVRQFFLASHAVIREYMYEGTSTYRTAYNVLNDRWFPVVPTRDGLVWSRAARTLQFLESTEKRMAQTEALRRLEAFFEKLSDPSVSVSQVVSEATGLRAALEDLSLDGAASLLSRTDADLLEQSTLKAALEKAVAEKSDASAEAREFLKERLQAADEWPLSLLESNLEKVGYSSRERLLAETGRLPDARQSTLRERVAQLEGMEGALREAAQAMGESDRNLVLLNLRERAMERVSGLGAKDFQEIRNRYIYRLDRDERRSILNMDGTNGPNQNLFAFIQGKWDTPQERATMETLSLVERVRAVAHSVPWTLYLKPLLNWGFLFLVIYGFLMCLAEWLRRKWVSRENLPFPLVEVADTIIRHDYRLETAGDLTRPERRDSAFQTLFLIGCGIGFVLLFVQGLGHYGLIGNPGIIKFDFTANIFEPAGGALKNLPDTIFVLSPIVIGIVFLLSLEMGFSIWFTYVLYAIGVFIVQGASQNVTDGNWTGWSDGKLYPFPMEQLLGAVTCFALYHLWKARGKSGSRTDEVAQPYLPNRVTQVGIVLLPLVILYLFWDLGVTDLPFLVFFFAAVLMLTIAIARTRAETGLPLNHAIYEFTKFPIIFGLTGAMGAKAYASFLNLVFLPSSLLFRTLPQQLENLELARRYKISFRAVAWTGFGAVATALGAGFVSFLLFSYAIGQDFYGFAVLPPLTGGNSAINVAHYPLWVGHFLGEPGLDNFTEVNWYRMTAIGAGFLVVTTMVFLRTRFMRFPLHPIGYLVLLMTIVYAFETPYQRVPDERPLLSSAIWGGAFMAWLIKRLVVKYGGMNVYKKAKPLFVGLIIGAVLSVFFWNMLDLGLSLYAARDIVPNDFIRRFTETGPFTPAYF